MEDDFPDDDNNDVLIKKESDDKIDGETIPYASLKKRNDNEIDSRKIDDRESIFYASLRRESEDEIDEKMYEKPKLKTPAEIERKAIIDEQIFTKSELEQIKVDLKLSKKAELKRF